METQTIVTHVAGSTLVGTEVLLTEPTIRFGRNPENDVAFDPESDVGVSGFHAEMTYADGAWTLRDLGSRNGTFVNGRQIDSVATVKSGDEIQFGQSGPQVTIRFPSDVAGGPQRPTFVGERTLVYAIDQVVARERTAARRIISGIVGGGVLAALTIAAVVWQSGRSLDETKRDVATRIAEAEAPVSMAKDKLGEVDRRLEEVRQLHASSQEDLQRLTAAISRQQDRIAEIESSPDLSSGQRDDLLEDARQRLVELTDGLNETQQQLSQATVSPDWPSIVEPYLRSVFLCYYDDGVAFGAGTAFAIDPEGVLVTNAHVAEAMKTRNLKLVVENVTGTIYHVRELRVHPEYDGSPHCLDLALIRADTRGDRLRPVDFADDDELRELQVGSQLGTLGFPGELLGEYSDGIDLRAMRSATAVATFKNGWVGMLTDFSLKAADFENSLFIQHSASVSHGTSGSPLFNTQGKTVAINNSGRDLQLIASHDEIDTGPRLRSAHPAEISRGIRIDAVRSFKEQIGW